MPIVKKPIDRYYAVYLIILLNGFGILVMWNMWVTIAPAYYMEYKLIGINGNGTQYVSPYATNFLGYLILASNLPNFILNLVNLFFNFRGNLEKRIILSLVVTVLIGLITLIFTVIDTSRIVTIFFILTITTVIIQSAACGLYQNCLFGLVAVFPPRYTNAVVLGNNICGTFVSIANIITIVVTNNIQAAAFFYFLISLLAVLICLGSLFLLVKLDFYRYYMEKANKKLAKNEFIELTKNNNSMHVTEIKINNCTINECRKISTDDDIDLLRINFRMKLHLYYNVFKKIKVQCFNVWFIFVVTIALFPTIMADVKFYSENGKYNFIIPENLFTPVATYFFFNLFAFLGSFLANFVQWPKSDWLVIPVLAQIVFIPLMLSCNFRPENRAWPVMIYDTWIYIALTIMMATCSGYLSALALMYAPKRVEASKSTVAGMIAAFFLMFGIICGTLLTFAILKFMENVEPIQS